VLNKGDELGRFNMGSTVILLFEKNKINWEAAITANETTVVGQKIASRIV